MQTIAIIVLVAFFGGMCWSILRPAPEFSIRFSRGVVKFRGKFPLSRHGAVEEFLKREFPHCGRMTIDAIKASSGGLRIVVRGPLTDGDRQRIRNFFQSLG